MSQMCLLSMGFLCMAAAVLTSPVFLVEETPGEIEESGIGKRQYFDTMGGMGFGKRDASGRVFDPIRGYALGKRAFYPARDGEWYDPERPIGKRFSPYGSDKRYFDSLGGMALGKRAPHFDSLGGFALGKR